MRGPILAIDIGTTACKALCVRADGTAGAFQVLLYRDVEAAHDPTVWWDTMATLIERVCGDTPPPEAICLCGRGGGLVALDARGDLIPVPWPALLAEARSRPLHSPRYDRLASWGALYAVALRRVPEAARRITQLCGVKDYLNFRLTGVFATDASSAGCTAWPEDLAPFGIRAEMLPPIRRMDETLGPLLPGRGLPLPADLPVLVGGHDGVCANLGAGMVAVGDGCVTLGTNGVLRINTPGPLYPAAGFHTFTYPYLDGTWTSGGDVLDGGAAVAWAVRMLGAEASGSDGVATGLSHFDTLAQKAPAGARGLIFLPYLRGAASPHRDLLRRGAFLHLDGNHGQPELARAVLEGVALALRHIRDAFVQAGCRIEELCLTGGGARSKFWGTIIASVLDRPLSLAGPEASARGAALVAAVGMGVYPTFPAAASAMVLAKSGVTPDPAWADAYDVAYARYLEAAVDRRV